MPCGFQYPNATNKPILHRDYLGCQGRGFRHPREKDEQGQARAASLGGEDDPDNAEGDVCYEDEDDEADAYVDYAGPEDAQAVDALLQDCDFEEDTEVAEALARGKREAATSARDPLFLSRPRARSPSIRPRR